MPKLPCDVMATPTHDSVRGEVTAWLDEHWDPERPLLEWRTMICDGGWAKPSWAEQWFGRGLPAWADTEVREAFRAYGAVYTPPGGGVTLASPTIYNDGSDEVKEKFLRPSLTGELHWTQLFSEPGNGSDLAGLTTTATRDGDEWIVNGQKVWSTSAHHADMAFIVARTDWDAPKHRGITYFLMDMHQPGIEVRGIKQMNNHSSFNEIFIADARIPDAWRVGDVGDGWRVARTTLSYERSLGGARPALVPNRTGRCWDECNEEAAEFLKTYSWYPQRAGRPDLTIERAQQSGAAQDPLVRQDLADLYAFRKASEWTAARARAARALGRKPGPEGSIGKLAASEIARRSARIHAKVAQSQALLAGTDPHGERVIAEVLISTPAVSIAGGTDDIQRNILGESMLGLPREPGPGRDTPFRDIPRN